MIFLQKKFTDFDPRFRQPYNDDFKQVTYVYQLQWSTISRDAQTKYGSNLAGKDVHCRSSGVTFGE